jgi:hypothetical protein
MDNEVGARSSDWKGGRGGFVLWTTVRKHQITDKSALAWE